MTLNVPLKTTQAYSVAELAVISGAIFSGDNENLKVSNVCDLSSARDSDLTVLHNKKYLSEFKKTKAAVCIVHPDHKKFSPKGLNLLLHDNPYKAFALIMQNIYQANKPQSHISANASIADSAMIGDSVTIEHGAYIANNVQIGAGSIIGVNSYIGAGVIIGRDCLIENNVSICNSIIGDKTIIKPGARIGQDGFGFASDANGHYKIPHIGKVCIGKDVEIGANTCIDRGSLADTIIGDMCRIDNLVQIGHNVEIGKGCVIVAQVGVSGSSKLGNFVTLAGKVGVAGHLKIAAGATVLASSTVLQSIDKKTTVAGYPAMPAMRWKRQVISQKKS